MKQVITDYLTFTKKERRGIFVLVVLIFVVLFLPYILRNYFTRIKKKTQPDKTAAIAVLEFKKDSLRYLRDNKNGYKEFEDADASFVDFSTKWKNYTSPVKGELFYFDPNTLNPEGWSKLGVSAKTVATIQNYLSKGGQFRHAEDIGKIYGLSDVMVERLLPYVQVAERDASFKRTNFSFENKDKTMPGKSDVTKVDKIKIKEEFLKNYKIDINTADTGAWAKLPGIGSKLSARINNFRVKLGGFYRVEQVAETFGLPDTTFQKIKNNLVCSANSVQKLNINAAAINHPYIPKNLANNILQYRIQHGNYKNVADLRKLALFDEAVFQKILPYIVAE